MRQKMKKKRSLSGVGFHSYVGYWCHERHPTKIVPYVLVTLDISTGSCRNQLSVALCDMKQWLLR